MQITITNAMQPTWMNAEHTLLNLLVKFEHLCGVVTFTASSTDIEPHGRLIFERAAAGEYGEVAEYAHPTPAEIAARNNPPLRANKMAEAVARVTHWEMMGNPNQADAWRTYYRELYALELVPDWPQVSQWPIPPEA